MVINLRHIVYLVLAFVGVYVNAQNSFVSLEVSPLEVEVGAPVTILIKTDADGALDFDLPDEFTRAGGTQSGMSSSIDYAAKTAIQFSYQKFVGYFEEDGKYTIGPVEIKSSNGVLKSESYQIKVSEPINLISADPSKNLDQAIFGIIEQSKREIYEGEPVVLSAKTYSQVNLVDDQKIYTPFEFDGPAEKYTLQSNAPNRINKEKINGREVISFSVGKTLYYPEKPGKYTVQPFQLSLLYEDPNRLSLQRAQIKSNKTSLIVKALPSGMPKSFIGAVGNFNISSTSETNRLKKGEVFELIITISGKGNLHNIEKPTLKLPKGLVVYGDPIVKDSIVFSSEGASGAIQLTYNIQAIKADKYTIEPIEISFFDTKSEKYKTVRSKRLGVKVLGEKGINIKENKKSKPNKQSTPLKTILVNNTRPAQEQNTFYNTPLFWSTTTAPLALGLIFGLFFRYRDENKEQIAENSKKKSAKKIAQQQLEIAATALTNEDSETFYLTIEKSIKTLLARKTGTVETEITRKTIKTLSNQNRISSKNSNVLNSILDQCDQARYGFEGTQELKADILDRTKVVLDELDKELKI